MAILNIGTNAKLGKRIASLSRPVGPTCPSSCPFLTGKLPDGSLIPKGERCYAESIEKRYTSVSANWAKNRGAVWSQWVGAFVAEIKKAAHKVEAIRIHVGGDWLDNDELDRPYLAAMLVGLRRAARSVDRMPAAWFYTHAWRDMLPHKKYLGRLGVQGFASVHDAREAKEAAAMGWRLAIDPGEHKEQAKPGFREIYGVRSLQCPEQLGKIKCDSCAYCFKGGGNRGNVTFSRH